MNETFDNIIEYIRKIYHQPHGFIPLHAPVFGGNEKKYLIECIDSTYVSSVGKFVEEFETQIALYTGARYAVACVNGTSALFLALKLAGVDNGHEVITQPLTFIATANAITYCGAKPVFLDVDRDTMGLSPEAISNFLKRYTRFDRSTGRHINIHSKKPITACVPMHTFGHPCRIDEITEICTSYNIPVIEDAAESLGSFFKDKHTGTFGMIGVLSFNGNKIVTSGGGGMLLINDEWLAKRAKHLTTQAKIPHPWIFDHDETGYNMRMPNINAALGLAQIEQLPYFLESKRKIAKANKLFFKEGLIKYIEEPVNSRANFWLNCILFTSQKERNSFLKYSNENGVMTRPVWQLMNKVKIFSNNHASNLENAEFLSERLVNIPSSVPTKMLNINI